MSLTKTDFHFKGQTAAYHGKVRDAYTIGSDRIVMVASDRISAFDVILPEGIPCKGQVLNSIAAYFLDATSHIIPNWKLAVPDPMATVGLLAEPLKVEVIVRGYIAGSAWRDYKAGAREICGVSLPDGLCENQKLPHPVITPTTKADEGHDLNISAREIVEQGLVAPHIWEQVEKAALALFECGSRMAAERGLILVDTKYEFGLVDGRLILIDEIHTPDSSRYFYAEGYEERLREGKPQKQLSKEFVRQWLLDNGFSGQPGQKLPEMTEEYCAGVSRRYIELYEVLTGQKFIAAADDADAAERIFQNCSRWLDENPT